METLDGKQKPAKKPGTDAGAEGLLVFSIGLT